MAASWECPSLPVISLPLKETSKASFLALKPLISSQYEEDGETFNDEIRQLNQLREHAAKPSRDYAGCNILRRYYAQLHLLRARFPPESAQIVIDFAWKDVYTGKEVCKEGLNIEQASVLYNIGALHSLVGGRDSRQTEQGMKEAVTHFQCSAGAFAYLSENYPANGCQDLSPQLIDMYCNLLLGQAQECLVEKSLKGLTKVKNLSISRVAMKVAEYYQSVLLVLESDVGAAVVKKFKDWPKLLQIKNIYYTSIAHLYQANSLEEQNNFGFMIAFQQLALQKLQSIGKIPKGVPDVVKEAVKHFQEYLTTKLHESQKQNDQVFHELVPSLDSLEPAQGAELVKPVVFQPADRKATGSDIFSRLIPMRAYEAASVFSEEKAKILRSILSSVDAKNAELENFLKSLNAEEMSDVSSEPPSLPADLLQQHQLLQGNEGSVRALQKKIEDLMSMSQQADQQLQAMIQRKREEEQEEAEFQERNGPRAGSQVCAAIWKEMDSLQKYHQQAIKSNSDLKAMFEHHLQNLILLCGPTPSLKSAIPTLSLMDAPEDSGSQRFHEVMAKVDEMRRQRTMLVKQLRDAMDTDDITRAVIGESGSNQDALIDDHMKKHRDHTDIIRQNLTAQDCILKALTEANAQRAKMRLASQELAKRREAWFISLAKSAGHYKFLQSKITEGVGFYAKLSESVERLHARCMEVCNDRRKKRQNIERRASPSLQSQQALPLSEEASRAPSSEQGTAARPPGGDLPAPASANRPSRPPKKAEFRGEPLPPRAPSVATPTLPTDTSTDSRAGSGGVSADNPSDVERMIHGLRETQEKQRTALGMSSIAATAGMQDGPGAQTIPSASTDSQQPSPESAIQQISSPDSHPPQPGSSVKPVPGPNSPIPSHSLPGSHSGTPVPPTSHLSLPSDSSSPSHLSADPGLEVPGSGPHPPAALLPGIVPDPGPNPQVPNSVPLPQPPAPISIGQLSNDLSSRPSQAFSLLEAGSLGAGTQQEAPRPSMPDLAPSQPAPVDPSNTALLPPRLPSAFSSPVAGPQPPHLPSLSASMVSPQVPPSSLNSQAFPPADATEPVVITGSGASSPHSLQGGVPSLLDTPPVVPHAAAHDGAPSAVSAAGNRLEAGYQAPQPLLNSSGGEMPGSRDASWSASTSSVGELTLVGDQSLAEPQPVPLLAAAQPPPLLPGEAHPPPSLPDGDRPPSSLPGVAAQPSLLMKSSGLDALDAFQLSKLVPMEKHAGESTTSVVPIPTQPPLLVSDVRPSPSLAVPLSLETPSILPISLALPSGPQPIPSPSVSLLAEPSSLTALPQPSVSVPLSSIVPLHSAATASLSSTNSHLESLLLKQQETIQSQTRQIEEQKEQLRQQSREVSECHRETEQLRLQHQLQEKDKLATTSNQSMLMQLLQSQQEMFSSQQGQVDKLSVVVDNQRREHMETEVELRRQIAQEQARSQSLQGQLAQQRKDLEHYQQQAMISAQQVQAVQTQAQQYLAQIQERDKVLASYRDEHKKIVDNLEQQYRQRIQQLTQQMQELLSSRKPPGGSGAAIGQPALPTGLPPPIQPQQLVAQPFGGGLPERSGSPSRPPHSQLQGGPAAPMWMMGGPQKPAQPPPAPVQPTSQGSGQTSSQLPPSGQQTPFAWTSPGQRNLPGHRNNPPSQPTHPGLAPLPPTSQPAHLGKGPPPTSASQPSYPGHSQQQALPSTQPLSLPRQGAPLPSSQPSFAPTSQPSFPPTSQPSFPTQGPLPHVNQPSYPTQGPPPVGQPSFGGQGPPLPTSQPSFPGHGPPASTGHLPGQGPPSSTGQPPFPGHTRPPPSSQGPLPPGQGAPPLPGQHPFPIQSQQPPPMRQDQVPNSHHPGGPLQPPPTSSQQPPNPVGAQGPQPSPLVHQQIQPPPPQQTHSQPGQVGAPPQWPHLPPPMVQGPPRQVNPSQVPPTGHPVTLAQGPVQSGGVLAAPQPQFSQPQPVGAYPDLRTSQPMGVPGTAGQPPLP